MWIPSLKVFTVNNEVANPGWILGGRGLPRALGCLPPPQALQIRACHSHRIKALGECHQGLQLTTAPWWQPARTQQHLGAPRFS